MGCTLQSCSALSSASAQLFALGTFGVRDWQTHATVYKMDGRRGPTVEHRELLSTL